MTPRRRPLARHGFRGARAARGRADDGRGPAADTPGSTRARSWPGRRRRPGRRHSAPSQRHDGAAARRARPRRRSARDAAHDRRRSPRLARRCARTREFLTGDRGARSRCCRETLRPGRARPGAAIRDSPPRLAPVARAATLKQLPTGAPTVRRTTVGRLGARRRARRGVAGDGRMTAWTRSASDRLDAVWRATGANRTSPERRDAAAPRRSGSSTSASSRRAASLRRPCNLPREQVDDRVRPRHGAAIVPSERRARERFARRARVAGRPRAPPWSRRMRRRCLRK